MSDEKQGKDELVRDTMNVSGVRNDWGFPSGCSIAGGPEIMRELVGTFPSIESTEQVNTEDFSCRLLPLPPGMSDADVASVHSFIRAITGRPKVVPTPRPEPEPETDDQRRERLFRSSILEYAQASTIYSAQVCSMRDQSGHPFPTTPHETSLMMTENRKLMARLVEDTKDLGYSPEEIYSAASEAEREVTTSIVQEGKPFVPDESMAVSAFYTNHRGDSAMRFFIPVGIWRGSTEYHPEEQWFMDVFDLDRGTRRTYAFAGFPGFVVPESSSGRTTGEVRAEG